MSIVVAFDHPLASDRALTGGKGANLGLLTAAGFTVPSGFMVTTRGFDGFIESCGLREKIMSIAAGLDFDDQAGVDEGTARIRELISTAAMPQTIRTEIAVAYEALGDDRVVAVRSSGTAEDLEGASFAGQHDTYLGVCGPDAVLDAVQRCWASLWTPRAAVYRSGNSLGFDAGAVSMSVVVQQMVRCEVSGVMFTANPLTSATDEIVINASWGLGEPIVQGVVTPDEFVVRAGTLGVIERTLGSKEVRMDAAGRAGDDPATSEVPARERERFCLSDEQVRDLAELGRRVEQHYGGWPQDIEWGLADGTFQLLQARPITGVEFSWDADMEHDHRLECDEQAVWSRCWSDAVSGGVVTPLMYSARFGAYSNSCYAKMCETFGFDDLAKIRTFKYWKGGLYYNLDFEMAYTGRSVWPAFRPLGLEFVPQAWHAELMSKPFSPLTYFRALARLQLLTPKRAPYGFFKTYEKWRTERPDVDGLPSEQLRLLSDRALRDYCERMVDLDREYCDDGWPWAFFNFRDGMFLLYWMVDKWYQDDSPTVFANLVSGTVERTASHREGDAIRELADEIRGSAELEALFDEQPGAEFFRACENSDAGRSFLEKNSRFLEEYGHRGHAERDIYYPRYADDPAVGYRTLRMLLSNEMTDPHAQEAEVETRRTETFDAVVAKLRRLPFGSLRVELFKIVFDFVHRNLLFRDNERFRPFDNITYAYKRGFVEIGRRLYERGAIDAERDVFFLSRPELYDLLEGRVDNPELLKAKIAGRARDCDRVLSGDHRNPMLLQRNREVVLDDASDQGRDGIFVGKPTSSGTVVGTARVITSLEQITTLRRGDILVVAATDPGWNPVFRIVAGVVVEAGGNLSHASCLSREFGLPAVNLQNALKLIPDGATVEVNGSTGRITLLDTTADTDPVAVGGGQ